MVPRAKANNLNNQSGEGNKLNGFMACARVSRVRDNDES
jgi:hypothetical protein